MPAKRVFILGAGFSKPCGFPLASELTQTVFERAYSDGGASTAHAPAAYLKWMRLWFPSCDFIKGWPDFEELLTIIDEWEQFRSGIEDSKSDDGRGYTPERFKNILLRHLRGLLLDRMDASVCQGLEPVLAFVDQLDPVRDSIISFNWDLLLEHVLQELGREYSYELPDLNVIPIAKPHGSILWSEMDADCANGILAPGSNLRARELWRGEKTVVLCPTDINDTRVWAIHRWAKPVIVEPNSRKSYTSCWINHQWERAIQMVRLADEVYVLGYSLPAADIRPRILLRLATAQIPDPHWRKPLRKFLVIDPKWNELCNRFRECVGESVDGASMQWEDWLHPQ